MNKGPATTETEAGDQEICLQRAQEVADRMSDEIEAQLRGRGARHAEPSSEEVANDFARMDTKGRPANNVPLSRPFEPETTSPPKTTRIDTDSDKFAQQWDAKAEAATISEGTQEAWDEDVEAARLVANHENIERPDVRKSSSRRSCRCAPVRELRKVHTMADLADLTRSESRAPGRLEGPHATDGGQAYGYVRHDSGCVETMDAKAGRVCAVEREAATASSDAQEAVARTDKFEGQLLITREVGTKSTSTRRGATSTG